MNLPEYPQILKLPLWFAGALKKDYEESEARAIARIVMEELSGKPIAALLADPDAEWSDGDLIRLRELVQDLKQGVPIQYILGFADFMEQRFEVKPGVLIPRNETEELVYWIREDWKDRLAKPNKPLQILDIGCGSGIIGISLAKELPASDVTCADLHAVPLEVSRRNAQLAGVPVRILEMDALNPDPIWWEQSFDVIVSNPPYVTESQKKDMAARVLEHEPEQALFVSDADPLLYYRQIALFASETLLPGGALYFEINESLGNATKDLLLSYFSSVELRKDIHGKDRMIKASHGTR